jgi:pimeloyl-ACP methyl ester carboxylesterase
MDHLNLSRANLIGYSMGAYLALAAAIRAPDRFERLVLGGIGGRMLSPASSAPQPMTLAEALVTSTPDTISDPIQKGFRRFAEAQGDDRQALAACSQASGGSVDRAVLARLCVPVLVVAGARDELAGSPQILAEAFANAKAVELPGCDHFTAISHALFRAAVFDFLEGWEDDAPAFE